MVHPPQARPVLHNTAHVQVGCLNATSVGESHDGAAYARHLVAPDGGGAGNCGLGFRSAWCAAVGEAVPEMWWVSPSLRGAGGTRLEWEQCGLGREGPEDVMPLMVMKAFLGGGVASWSLLRAVFRRGRRRRESPPMRNGRGVSSSRAGSSATESSRRIATRGCLIETGFHYRGNPAAVPARLRAPEAVQTTCSSMRSECCDAISCCLARPRRCPLRRLMCTTVHKRAKMCI